jgi:hypothetical protein
MVLNPLDNHTQNDSQPLAHTMHKNLLDGWDACSACAKAWALPQHGKRKNPFSFEMDHRSKCKITDLNVRAKGTTRVEENRKKKKHRRKFFVFGRGENFLHMKSMKHKRKKKRETYFFEIKTLGWEV